MTRCRFVVLMAAVGALGVVPAPAAQAASVIVVPTNRPTIQSAVDAASPGDTILVRSGTFVEQVTIGKTLTIVGAGARATTISAPAVLAPRVIGSVPGRANIVEVYGGATVTMRGLGVAGPAATSCLGLAGISVQDGATLRLDAASIRNCTDIGMFVGFASFLPFGPEVGHAVVTGTEITGSRIAGIRAAAPGTTLGLSASKVRLPYVPAVDGQVGVSVVDGAVGTLTGSTVSGAICDHPDCGPDFLTQLQGTGILLLGAAPGSVVSQNIVTDNDIGIAVGFTVDCCRMSQNTLRDNRYYGIGIADGRQTISHTTVTGGLVGVVSVSFDAPATATLEGVVITGAATPVQELSCCGLPSTVQGSYFIQ
jgi:nitrous oxidase accessory protein NosD